MYFNVRHMAKGVLHRRPLRSLFADPERSSLPRTALEKIQSATFHYTYKGRPCIKNPFDLALYVRLLEQVKPATIVEIGSYQGGSALWFAAQSRALGFETHVVSVDIEPVEEVDDVDVRFIRGDIHDLFSSELPQILENCARPLLVIEDGPHTFEGCEAALNFFHKYLKSGEYIVVEDGILADLGLKSFKNGPNRAIKGFLNRFGNEYQVDRSYCDYFGHNVTWNTNGYLLKK